MIVFIDALIDSPPPLPFAGNCVSPSEVKDNSLKGLQPCKRSFRIRVQTSCAKHYQAY